MGSLFASLDIGRKSLQAHQLALQVTSNNISNINTPGYSRLHAVFATDRPVETGAGPIGTGVTVRQIESARDQFIELRLVQEVQNQAQEDAVFNALDQIQEVLSASAQGMQNDL